MSSNTSSHPSSFQQNVPSARACTQEHTWQPTIILGYFQCARCHKLAACSACVSKVRGKALIGYCRAHLSLRTSDTSQEVLG